MHPFYWSDSLPITQPISEGEKCNQQHATNRQHCSMSLQVTTGAECVEYTKQYTTYTKHSAKPTTGSEKTTTGIQNTNRRFQ